MAQDTGTPVRRGCDTVSHLLVVMTVIPYGIFTATVVSTTRTFTGLHQILIDSNLRSGAYALNLFRPVLFVCGILAFVMSAFLLVPSIYAGLTGGTEAIAFLTAAATALTTGVLLITPGLNKSFSLNARQLYLLTSISWLMLSVFSALPFIFSHKPLSAADALFEAISGITTTGSTVLAGLNELPKEILLWRSLMQWIGGFGVIGMAVSILPFLRVGGMRLFQTESSDWSDKSLPRFQDMARGLLLVYCSFTALCTMAYWLAGMQIFDAINHAMTTVSTGGYATDDSSMGRFNSTILWIAIIFMLLGGMPFALFIRLLSQRRPDALRDQQLYGFLMIVFVMSAGLTLHRTISTDVSLSEAATHVTFNLVSVITTTGFASQDYTTWGVLSISLFFFATFIGGCSGSTSGGMKVFRFQLSWLFLRDQMYKLVHPRGVFSIRYNGKSVSEDIMVSAVAFSFLFFIILALTTLGLAFTGLDFVTSLTGAATALTNVGPGLGHIIGPAGNFSSLPDPAKWILSFAMILGRLELLTVMVLLTPVFWRG